jgi:hypothetical protein
MLTFIAAIHPRYVLLEAMMAGEEALANIRLEHGNAYPYDAPDAWWNADTMTTPPAAVDWAHAAARGILADLKDRRTIKWGFDDTDEDVRAEIVSSIAEIIRTALRNLKASDHKTRGGL